MSWKKEEKRKGGIKKKTQEKVECGKEEEMKEKRKAVLREAWAAHPERFVSGQPKPKPLPEAVWINPPNLSLTTQDIAL